MPAGESLSTALLNQEISCPLYKRTKSGHQRFGWPQAFKLERPFSSCKPDQASMRNGRSRARGGEASYGYNT